MEPKRRSTLAYIGDMSGQLSILARRQKFDYLAAMLELASEKARMYLSKSEGSDGGSQGSGNMH